MSNVLSRELEYTANATNASKDDARPRNSSRGVSSLPSLSLAATRVTPPSGGSTSTHARTTTTPTKSSNSRKAVAASACSKNAIPLTSNAPRTTSAVCVKMRTNGVSRNNKNHDMLKNAKPVPNKMPLRT